MKPQALGVLLDVELPVTVRLGSALLPFGEVLDLNPGSVVEFEGAANDQVEVLVNGRLVGRGQLVTVQGNYGVRLTEISSRGSGQDAGQLDSAASGDV
ncbi:MAG TPA: FliM/FliN family flagellar motor switch protein [Bryobacteraceae bacterium]|nr:FliM/FliN family flagellar motor switch protein [Bryobacteraceae bacterium]